MGRKSTERDKISQAIYRASHQEELTAYRRAYWIANKERLARQNRNNKLKRYGLTPEKYAETVEAQQNKCAICFKHMDEPHIDHDHETGVVRGLLCGRCNRGIGNFDDDPIRLEAAIRYLNAE